MITSGVFLFCVLKPRTKIKIEFKSRVLKFYSEVPDPEKKNWATSDLLKKHPLSNRILTNCEHTHLVTRRVIMIM